MIKTHFTDNSDQTCKLKLRRSYSRTGSRGEGENKEENTGGWGGWGGINKLNMSVTYFKYTVKLWVGKEGFSLSFIQYQLNNHTRKLKIANLESSR